MDLTGFTLNTADFLSVAVIVMTAYGTIWGAKRVLSLVSR